MADVVLGLHLGRGERVVQEGRQLHEARSHCSLGKSGAGMPRNVHPSVFCSSDRVFSPSSATKHPFYMSFYRIVERSLFPGDECFKERAREGCRESVVEDDGGQGVVRADACSLLRPHVPVHGLLFC